MESSTNKMLGMLSTIYKIDYTKIYNKTEFDRNIVGSAVYGETGFNSIESIIKEFNEFFNENTVFYDIGSGLGKIVYHIGLKYNVKKSCGIEYSKERYDCSLKIRENFNIKANNITFLNANVLECNILDATVIYTDNTAFPKNINDLIYKKIPKGCLVISRNFFKEAMQNKEIIKKNINDSSTNYGTNSLYFFIKL
jgi:hypothetical protein